MARWPAKDFWTQRELQALKPADRGTSLADGGSLAGEVRVSGDDEAEQSVAVAWRFGFKWKGKKAWHYCGTWPLVGMAQIRAERNDARELVKKGIDPRAHKKAKRIENQLAVEAQIAEAKANEALAKTCWQMVEAWLDEGVMRKDGNAELRRSFTKDLKPVIGHILVKDLTYSDLRAVIKPVIERTTYRTAQALHDNMVQLFSWAEQRQPWRKLMADGNPMVLVDLAQMLPNDVDPNAPRERVLTSDEIRELGEIFYRTSNAQMRGERLKNPDGTEFEFAALSAENRLAIWICLATLCRIGELLQARWEDVDFKLRQWLIPAGTSKRKRNVVRKDHLVVLSPLAMTLFTMLHETTGNTEWCFPGPADEEGKRSHIGIKTLSRLVGERQAKFKKSTEGSKSRKLTNCLVLSEGKNGKWTPHDLRRTGATLMQGLGIDEKIIDLCQNHVIEGPKVRKHYLHYPFFREQEQAWRTLGDHLAGVLGIDTRAFASFLEKQDEVAA